MFDGVWVHPSGVYYSFYKNAGTGVFTPTATSVIATFGDVVNCKKTGTSVTWSRTTTGGVTQDVHTHILRGLHGAGEATDQWVWINMSGAGAAANTLKWFV